MPPEIVNEHGDRLIGEPVTRPDRIAISIWRSGANQRIYFVDFEGAQAFFEEKDLELYGDGNLDRGINLVGQAYYETSEKNLLVGAPNLIYEEIKKIRAEERQET